MSLIMRQTRVNGLPDSEDGIMLCLFVLTQYRRVTDGHTERHTEILQLRQRSV